MDIRTRPHPPRPLLVGSIGVMLLSGSSQAPSGSPLLAALGALGTLMLCLAVLTVLEHRRRMSIPNSGQLMTCTSPIDPRNRPPSAGSSPVSHTTSHRPDVSAPTGSATSLPVSVASANSWV